MSATTSGQSVPANETVTLPQAMAALQKWRNAEARGMERAAEAEFPDSWRDDAHAVHAGGGLKAQRTWSAGFNACRNAIRAEAAAIRSEATK